jgi:hypothetical protein
MRYSTGEAADLKNAAGVPFYEHLRLPAVST